MAGRPPKPTALKELQGNPGKRPLNQAEAKFASSLPKCPTFLKGEAKREWKRVAEELYEAGLLESVDRAALAAYCMSWSRWQQAERALMGEELVLVTDKGYMYPNPLLAIAKNASAEMRTFMNLFGMTPSSRSKVTARKNEEEDPFETWVKKSLDKKEDAEKEEVES